MVSKICEMKNILLQRAENDINERGIERINVAEMGEIVDMIKDLAQAEAYCWKADYYRAVTEGMDQWSQDHSGVRAGYGEDMQHHEHMESDDGYSEALRAAFVSASPDGRTRIRNEVMKLVGAM